MQVTEKTLKIKIIYAKKLTTSKTKMFWFMSALFKKMFFSFSLV